MIRAKSQEKKKHHYNGERQGKSRERQWAAQGGLYGGSAPPWFVETVQEAGEGY